MSAVDSMRIQPFDVDAQIEKLLFVSDLHGFVEPLAVLDRVIASLSENVQVVAVGDYVVAGVRPAEVVAWVRQNAGRFAVKGNHDQGALAAAQGDHPAWTEPGAQIRLSGDQRDYLREIPDMLELSWRGSTIRVVHGRKPTGEWVDWQLPCDAVFDFFADKAVDLTVTGHTHDPFVLERDGCRVANCGSTSMLIQAFKNDAGAVLSRRKTPAEPLAEIFSTYLLVANDGTDLSAQVESFDYDRQKELQLLRDAGRPHIEALTALLETAVFAP